MKKTRLFSIVRMLISLTLLFAVSTQGFAALQAEEETFIRATLYKTVVYPSRTVRYSVEVIIYEDGEDIAISDWIRATSDRYSIVGSAYSTTEGANLPTQSTPMVQNVGYGWIQVHFVLQNGMSEAVTFVV